MKKPVIFAAIAVAVLSAVPASANYIPGRRITSMICTTADRSGLQVSLSYVQGKPNSEKATLSKRASVLEVFEVRSFRSTPSRPSTLYKDKTTYGKNFFLSVENVQDAKGARKGTLKVDSKSGKIDTEVSCQYLASTAGI